CGGGVPCAESAMNGSANNIPAGLGFSWVIFLTLITVFGVSVTVFVWQVRRWTTHRGWRELLDWSRERGFTLSRPQIPPREPFDRIAGARVITLLERGNTRAMQLQVAAAATSGGEATRWHALVRQIASPPWPPTGVRP